jgi:hypothetical protein
MFEIFAYTHINVNLQFMSSNSDLYHNLTIGATNATPKNVGDYLKMGTMVVVVITIIRVSSVGIALVYGLDDRDSRV